MYDLYGCSIEQMLGKPTIHVPLNFVIQNMGDNKFIGVWQSSHPNFNNLLFGSEKTHQVIMADAFIRPQLVCDSNEFRGYGLNSMLTHGMMEVEKWNPIFKR